MTGGMNDLADACGICTANTSRRRRCMQRAWWPGGRCWRHVGSEPMGVLEWLRALVLGGAARSLPRTVELYPARRHEQECDDGKVLSWWSYSDRGRRSIVVEPAKVLLVLGANGIESYGCDVNSQYLRLAVAPDDLVVALDKLLASTSAPSAAVVSIFVHTVVERASELDAALALGVSLQAVRWQRERLDPGYGRISKNVAIGTFKHALENAEGWLSRLEAAREDAAA